MASGDCGRCSECYRDVPGYTFEIPECIRRSNGSDKVCMSVSSPPYNYNNTEEIEGNLIVISFLSEYFFYLRFIF